MTRLRAAIASATARLAEAGIDGAARDARILLAEVIGVKADRLSIEPDRDLTEAEGSRVDALLTRRIAREPVSRILNRRLFWGREFAVTADTLDPRPETEILIATALELGPMARFADLGTGTGIIGVTLLAEWPQAHAVITDLDPACLKVALANAARHRVADRADFIRSDWFSALSGPFNLIASNPPYIAVDEMTDLAAEVLHHDPHLALTDHADGLTAYRQITAEAVNHLVPGGVLMVEIGPTQAAAVAALCVADGLISPEIRQDFDGRDRVVLARAPV